MKSWVWISCLAIGAVMVVLLWFDPSEGWGEQGLSPAETVEDPMKPNQGIKDASAAVLDDAAPLPLKEVLSKVERLAAPIARPPGSAEQTIEQLQREAERLIKQGDGLLVAENLFFAAMSEAEQSDIEQRPEFQATLGRESALESRLESLP